MAKNSGRWRTGARVLGMLLLLLAALALLDDWRFVDGALRYRPTALGARWHGWDAASLNLTQAIVERYVLPQLWTYVFLPLLLAPAWAVAAGAAVMLMGLSYVRIPVHRAANPSR